MNGTWLTETLANVGMTTSIISFKNTYETFVDGSDPLLRRRRHLESMMLAEGVIILLTESVYYVIKVT